MDGIFPAFLAMFSISSTPMMLTAKPSWANERSSAISVNFILSSVCSSVFVNCQLKNVRSGYPWAYLMMRRTSRIWADILIRPRDHRQG
jgi:hypothetical protein